MPTPNYSNFQELPDERFGEGKAELARFLALHPNPHGSPDVFWRKYFERFRKAKIFEGTYTSYSDDEELAWEVMVAILTAIRARPAD